MVYIDPLNEYEYATKALEGPMVGKKGVKR
jgi:hypothetical protein